MTAPYIVGIGGALRAGSSTEKALRHVLGAIERAGGRTIMFTGEALDLPLYAPDRPERTSCARKLVGELSRADGVLIGSPGYHGNISGAIKNMLDYTEDLRADARPYLSGRPVGCLATAAGWPAAVNTLNALRDVVHALRGWPTPLGVAINTAEPVFEESGRCISAKVSEQLDTVADELWDFIKKGERQ